jgi:hypothetical protein
MQKEPGEKIGLAPEAAASKLAIYVNWTRVGKEKS